MIPKLQRLKHDLAINYLDIIDICEKYIAAGNNVRYFRSVKEEAIERYAEAEAMIAQPAVKEAAQYNIVS